MRRTWNCWSEPKTGTRLGFCANSTLSRWAPACIGVAHAATVAAPRATPAFRNSRRGFFMGPPSIVTRETMLLQGEAFDLRQAVFQHFVGHVSRRYEIKL